MNRILRGLKRRASRIIDPSRLNGLRRVANWLYARYEKLLVDAPSSVHLQKQLRPGFKIGMAVLAHERPEYLELCLDSLFATRLYEYDISFLIQDDGSRDPRVRQIIERPQPPEYKIIRVYNEKGSNSWGATFNRAMQTLLELGDFDIIGSCDGDALFHPEWLDRTMKVCTWAKAHHRANILGPFSSFHSSDDAYHKVLGVYSSPEGRYVVKRGMGAVNYFYYKDDFLKLGYFTENRDDETLMTQKFNKLRVRNFCTDTSYVEHIGHLSILNQWRPVQVASAVYGLNLASEGWPASLEKADTMGYYRCVHKNISFGEQVHSDTRLDLLIPVVEKDLPVLPYVVEYARKNLRHPIGKIYVAAPSSQAIQQFCSHYNCEYVFEDQVLYLRRADINFSSQGWDRSGWMLQQFIKLSADAICQSEHILALDADTVLIRPQIFTVQNKTLLLHSDEHHQAYFDLYARLLGVPAPSSLSFVGHTMLFHRTRLQELRQEIERRHQKVWYDAILTLMDRSQPSPFSEYETYGQWMFQNYPGQILREYWYNTRLNRSQLSNMHKVVNRYAQQYRSLSFHVYRRSYQR